jgi:hypothetical protein
MLFQSVFLTLDLIMISQYFYYGKPNIVKEEAIEETLSVAESSDYGSFSKKSRSATSLMGLMLFGMPWSSLHTNSITTSSSNGITFGIILAWSCVSLDIGSRFPQFFKNWKRSSVEGVSNLLLIWALAGNFSYGSSIVLHPGRTENEFWETFPYIFGSAVTLCLDMLLYGQFLYYIRKKSQANAIVV